MILKSATVENQEVTDKELALINKHTLTPLTKEEVFTFKLAMCDNEVDRDYEVFPLKTLKDLQKMYVGKTVIKDHRHTADNQVARIYSTELVEHSSKTTKTGETYTQLVAHCYMLNTESNKDLIAEIKGGIKKEVSVGCSCGSAVCSVCGTDNRQKWCDHFWGKVYDGKECYFRLEKAKDAYEVSFVAVPAQPKAGTTKNYGAEKEESNEDVPDIDVGNIDETTENEPETDEKTAENNSDDLATNEVNDKELEVSTKMKLLDSFILCKEKEINSHE